MSKKRGLSIEEKKQVVLQIFHETKDVFVLKDLEKLAPKRGIISQSVKEVVQALVDDDLVHQDKIGASNFFWSFPSEAAVKLRNDVKQKEGALAELEAASTSLAQQIEAAKQGKEDSAERVAKLASLHGLEQELAAAQKELAQYADNDPQKVDAMRDATAVAKAAANRWMDNLWALQSWCKRQFEGSDLSSFFREAGLTEDLDYID